MKTADNSWLIKKLQFEKECGHDNESYLINNKTYYLVPCVKGKALIGEDLPKKEEYSLNMHTTHFSRKIHSPKNSKQYYWAKKDYRWIYNRNVVASDHIKDLPDVYELINLKH